MLFLLLPLVVSSASAQDVCVRDTFFPAAGNCGYDVQDYQLTMNWTLENDHWDVSEVVTFVSEWDTDELQFDFTDSLEITALSIDGAAVDYDREKTKLTVHYNFAHDTEYKLYAAFNGKLMWGELFDPEGKDRKAEDGFCMLNEPTNAWRYYICNDHPKDKATYHYSFTVPASYVPAGVGRLVMIEEANETVILPGKSYVRDWDPEASEGFVTFTYIQDTLTAPYLFTVCAGAFDMKMKTLENGKVELDFVDNGHKDQKLAWELADLTPEVISTLESFFGKYPYEDLGGIFAKTYMGAALETQGRSMYDNATTTASVIAHETTHQWMGDLISLSDWSDLWLKEGAATFGQALWAEHVSGKEGYEENIRNLYERLVNGRTEIKEVDETIVDSLKDNNTYAADTRFDHDTAVQTIANFCQIDRDQVQLKDGDVTIDEWGEGLAASCDTVYLNARSYFPFFEMVGHSTETISDNHSIGPKDMTSDDIKTLYGAEVYYGGSIVYHSLRYKLGDETFKEALQTLISENKWGNVDEEKFIEVFNRVSGENMTDFIKSYLYYGELGHIPDLVGIETWEETRAKFER